MAITKAITYPPRVGFRYGSMRGSGMVSGSKGYGPAGAGGQAMGPSGNQGGNQGGGGGGGGNQQSTQPAPNVPTQNFVANTPENAEIQAAGATIDTTSGFLTDGAGNLVAQGKALQSYRDQVAANKEYANQLNLSLPGYSPTLTMAEQLSYGQQLTDLYNQAVGNIQTENLGLLSEINPNYSAGTGITVADVQGLTDLSGQSALTQQIANSLAENLAAQKTTQDLNTSAVDKSLEKETAANRLSGILAGLGEDISTDLSDFGKYLTKKGPLGVLGDVGSLAYSAVKAPVTPTGMGLTIAGMLGDMVNTNYRLQDDGTITSSITGALGFPDYTNLAGLASAKNLIGYDSMSPEEQEAAQQGILRDIVTFDDSPKGYTVDFSNVDKSKYNPGSDLEAAAREAAASVGGGPGGNADPIVTNTGTGGDTGDDGGDAGSGKTYTEAEERTMSYLAQMGYDRGYAEDYIDQGGTLFNFDIYDDTDFVGDYINT